jgi:hypothetical protein
MAKLKPRYSIWDGIKAALDLGRTALEEVQALKRIPGPAGRDGFGFDDLDVTYDGERTFTFRFSKDGHVKEFPFSVPIVLDRGVFKEGQAYKAGDGVTWGRHYWIAKKDTSDTPEARSDWRLAVKSGRDGRDAHGERPATTPIVRVGVPEKKG